MNKTLIRRLLLLLVSVAIFNGDVFADGDPTLHQVYQAAQSGKLNEAQAMMEKVLQDHPNSGKAHFVDAELLAKQGRLAKAETELATAERLAPGLPFAKAAAVQDLRSRISSAHPASTDGMVSPMPPHTAGFPWGQLLLGMGVIAVVIMIFRTMAARRTSLSGNSQMNTPGTGLASGGGGIAPMAPAGGGMGSGIMSSLATGAAMGAGLVAGEALVHHFMDGNRSGNPAPAGTPLESGGNNMGGQDFGVADNSGWEDNSDVADSSGSDDWG